MNRAPVLGYLFRPPRTASHQGQHIKSIGSKLHVTVPKAIASPTCLTVARSTAVEPPRPRHVRRMASTGDQLPLSPAAAMPAGSDGAGEDRLESNQQRGTGAGADSTPATASGSVPASEPELPPLTPEQHRVYDRLAVTMSYFHDHFRKTWTMLYSACESGRRPGNMSLKQFIDEGIQLTRYLTAHHGIEETHLFPLLGRKMPEFRSGGKGSKGGAGDLLRQHREIHAGMDAFEEYLRKCRSREVDLELSTMKEKMDSWGPVLLIHLDQEVETLRAENMRKYWTIDEMRAIPI